jgi:hypothetical protein
VTCPACGCIVGEGGICRHHVDGYTGDAWAESNRILCDLLHRGKAPARLDAGEREAMLTTDLDTFDTAAALAAAMDVCG